MEKPIVVTSREDLLKTSTYEPFDLGGFFDAYSEDSSEEDSQDLPSRGVYFDVNELETLEEYEALMEFFKGNNINYHLFTSNPAEAPYMLEEEGISYSKENPPDILPKALDENAAESLAAVGGLLSPETDLSENAEQQKKEKKPGIIYTFGSAKGGSGKTFTCLISAKYYAMEHPREKVCILDLDIEEPQLAIAARFDIGANDRYKSIGAFYSDTQKGDNSFEALKRCAQKNEKFPPNLDFYLAPRRDVPIRDQDFWLQLMTHLFYHYDAVFLDTGTTYMENNAVITAYKLADKILVVSQASIASAVTVSQQIKRLKGEIKNKIYSEDDELGEKIFLIITNYYKDNVCNTILTHLQDTAPTIASFGNLTKEINEIEILGRWELFDNNTQFRQGIDKILELS